MMTNEQIAKMKAKLLSNIVTVVKAEVSIEKGSIPEITIHENITKEAAARMAFEQEGKLIIVVRVEENEDGFIEEAVFEAKKLIYSRLEELGL